MSGRSLLIVGAGGHAEVAFDVARRMGCFADISFSSNIEHPETLMGRPVLDESRVWETGPGAWGACFVAVGDNAARESLTAGLLSAGARMATLIHPSATVSPGARLGEGCIVCAGANVGPSSAVGDGSIVNTGADVDHGCRVGRFCHLSPHAAMGGGSSVGDRSWLCIGSCMADHISLAADSVLGAGSALLRDAGAPGLYVGSPARLVRGIDDFA